MRLFFAVIASFVISIGIFFGMQLMISSDNTNLKESKKNRHLVYLREKIDTKVERKKRVKPKEPLKKPPVKKIKIVKTQLNARVKNNVKIKPFRAVTKNIDVSAISSLNGAQIAVAPQTLFDANSLQILKRVHPKYPRRAKMKKKNGQVQLAFLISKKGEVSNITIINATPPGLFEQSSIKAIKKWKFKPSGDSKNATITFNFRLRS